MALLYFLLKIIRTLGGFPVSSLQLARIGPLVLAHRGCRVSVFDERGQSVQQQEVTALGKLGEGLTILGVFGGSTGIAAGTGSVLSVLTGQGFQVGEERVHYKATGQIDNSGNKKLSTDEFIPFGQ